MNRYLTSIAAMLMMCLQVQPADAATSVLTYRFLANTKGPIPLFSGTAKLEIDDEDILSRVLAFDLEAPTQGFAVANAVLRTDFGGRVIALRSVAGDLLGPVKGLDGFILIFDRDSLNGGIFGYTLASEPDNEEGNGYRNVTVALVADAVPEPATWALMLLGFAAVGTALRRRRSPRGATVSG